MTYAVFGAENRTARKRHVCTYCESLIVPGTDYRRWASSDGGGPPLTVRAHPECIRLWRMVDPHADEVPMEPTEFRQDCEDRWPGCVFPWSPAPADPVSPVRKEGERC